jgi:hypothetical protein
MHHIALAMSETSFDVGYGLSRWLALEGRFAVRVVDVTPTYTELDGTPKTVVDDIHHHKETLVGPADPWLLVRVGASSGRWITAARAGVTLPLGSTVPDPYVLGREGLPHEHIQLGTGTVVPVVGGAVAYAAPSVELSLVALGFFSFYTNDNGYRAPMRGFVSARGTFPLPSLRLRPYVATDFVHDGPELWHGVVGADTYTRSDLLAGGGVAWRFAPKWEADVGFRVLLAKLATGTSLDYPGLVQLGLATHFDR